MVLDGHAAHALLRASPFCGEVIGMHVMRDDVRLDFEDALKMLDCFLEESKTLDIFKITDVLAEECVPPPRKANRIFQLAPNSKNLRGLRMQVHRGGSVPTRTSDRPDAPRHGLHD